MLGRPPGQQAWLMDPLAIAAFQSTDCPTHTTSCSWLSARKPYLSMPIWSSALSSYEVSQTTACLSSAHLHPVSEPHCPLQLPSSLTAPSACPPPPPPSLLYILYSSWCILLTPTWLRTGLLGARHRCDPNSPSLAGDLAGQHGSQPGRLQLQNCNLQVQ